MKIRVAAAALSSCDGTVGAQVLDGGAFHNLERCGKLGHVGQVDVQSMPTAIESALEGFIIVIVGVGAANGGDRAFVVVKAYIIGHSDGLVIVVVAAFHCGAKSFPVSNGGNFGDVGGNAATCGFYANVVKGDIIAIIIRIFEAYLIVGGKAGKINRLLCP